MNGFIALVLQAFDASSMETRARSFRTSSARAKYCSRARHEDPCKSKKFAQGRQEKQSRRRRQIHSRTSHGSQLQQFSASACQLSQMSAQLKEACQQEACQLSRITAQLKEACQQRSLSFNNRAAAAAHTKGVRFGLVQHADSERISGKQRWLARIRIVCV